MFPLQMVGLWVCPSTSCGELWMVSYSQSTLQAKYKYYWWQPPQIHCHIPPYSLSNSSILCRIHRTLYQIPPNSVQFLQIPFPSLCPAPYIPVLFPYIHHPFIPTFTVLYFPHSCSIPPYFLSHSPSHSVILPPTFWSLPSHSLSHLLSLYNSPSPHSCSNPYIHYPFTPTFTVLYLQIPVLISYIHYPFTPTFTVLYPPHSCSNPYIHYPFTPTFTVLYPPHSCSNLLHSIMLYLLFLYYLHCQPRQNNYQNITDITCKR